MEEIIKLRDPAIKALVLVNPTNPTGISLTKNTVQKMASFIRDNNPNLIILEDSVYAPFVDEFNNFFNVLPSNTIGIFSYSKYFGTTGYRLGTIVMHNRNIIDSRLLKEGPPEYRDSIDKRYKIISTKPSRIKFMDRILADSRQVAEAHVAGLSTPQQTIMGIMAMFDLMDKDNLYKQELQKILRKRMTDLLTPIEYTIDETDLTTNYYVVINIPKVVDKLTGTGYCGTYLSEYRDPFEFLLRLAKKYGTVLLPAVGFAGPFWSVRVSLANLDTELYQNIGINLRLLIEDYIKEFQQWQRKKIHDDEQARILRTQINPMQI